MNTYSIIVLAIVAGMFLMFSAECIQDMRNQKGLSSTLNQHN